MKLLRPGTRPKPENPDKKTTQVSERPLSICVVFDEDASARSADVLIGHVASDYECHTQSFSFDALDAPAPGVAAARSAADTDILVLAIRADQILPDHVRMWLGLCLGLRDEGREGALVALITKTAGTADLHPSLLEYLETVAIIGGLAFFPRQDSVPHAIVMDSTPKARRKMRGPVLISSPRMRVGAGGRANHRNHEFLH
jgi:hypothetical protein